MLWSLRQKAGNWIKGVDTTSRATPYGERDLSGDRQLEWSYVISRTAVYASQGDRVLDFGCDSGMLSIAACIMGCEVKGIDLLPQEWLVTDAHLEFVQTDVMELPDDKLFDVIIHSSVIEHVGLWGRYKEQRDQQKDIKAMQKLGRLLAPGGVMIMTLPVGVDKVVHPLHRIYGKERLPALIDGFSVEEECFWRKQSDNCWRSCSRDEACSEDGTERYYAIGGLVLKRR